MNQTQAKMHLILSVVHFALAAILISSAPLEEKLKSGSQETRYSYKKLAVQQKSLILPLVMPRHFIKARNRGFCFRRLSLSLAQGTSSGFKGWLRKYNSGYLAADEKLYLFFRCNPDKVVKKFLKLKRAKRSAQNTPTPPLPRPCINDTVPDESESSGLYSSNDMSVPLTRNPLCIQEDD